MDLRPPLNRTGQITARGKARDEFVVRHSMTRAILRVAVNLFVCV
jgi:hypothetical protein